MLEFKNTLEVYLKNIKDNLKNLETIDSDFKTMKEVLKDENPFSIVSLQLENLTSYLEKIYSQEKVIAIKKQLSMAYFLNENINRFKNFKFSQIEVSMNQMKALKKDIALYIENNSNIKCDFSKYQNEIQVLEKILECFDYQELTKPILDLEILLESFSICKLKEEEQVKVLLEVAIFNASIFKPDVVTFNEEDMFYDKDLNTNTLNNLLSLEDQIVLDKVKKLLSKNQNRLNDLSDETLKFINDLFKLIDLENEDIEFLYKTNATLYFKDLFLLKAMEFEINKIEKAAKENIDNIIKFLKNALNNYQKYEEKSKDTQPLKNMNIYFLSTQTTRNYLIQDLKKIDDYSIDDIEKIITDLKNCNIQNDKNLKIYNQRLTDVFEKSYNSINVDYIYLSNQDLLLVGCYKKNQEFLKSLVNRLEKTTNKKKIEEMKQEVNEEFKSLELIKINEQLMEQWLTFLNRS